MNGWQSIADAVLLIPRSVKRAIALAGDVVMCALSVWLAFYLRIGFFPPIDDGPLQPMIVSISLALPIFVSFGLYRAIFRHTGPEALISIFRAVAVYTLPFATVYTLIGVTNVPRTLGLIQPILLALMVSGTRIAARVMFAENYTARWSKDSGRRVAIYGAGNAGLELAAAIAASRTMRVKAFVDDDAALWGSTLRGLPILPPSRMMRLIEQHGIDDILLAIPSASRRRRIEILESLRGLPVHVRTLPSFTDIAKGTISVGDLRELDIEDLLGRAPIPPDEALLRRNVSGKVVMVSGAGGSIGSELCRQILRLQPTALLLVDHSEYNLYAIHQELSAALAERGDDPEASVPVLVPLLASVADGRRMAEVLAAWRPSLVVHAAAYKHVPLVEQNVLEGIRNNVVGTRTLAEAAHAAGVERFLLISTDKAVRPTNVMGATKRLAELVLQALQAEYPDMVFSMVRFGNVLGSSGSVIPLFRKQIAEGGPVTITHPEVTRYFMTVPEAAQLVLQAGAMAEGGDVFLLDMGEPVRIVDLARNMIELSGLTVCDEANPEGDIEIAFTGLRPGEKLYEELLIGDGGRPSDHPRIVRANEDMMTWRDLQPHLVAIERAIETGDSPAAREILGRLVAGYKPSGRGVDLTLVHDRDAAAG
ncbi:UDP-N-acetyl-alpha-D-glucosamine C6 dehydratase [Tsuneonella dongtanensis]|uniref:UDP-N-acetyl-alpha-D-glucosamine C6 dehydratase n=1 Tax=Tsuneonella dongtanensis TaxID=692370 RepID=A0A1B2A9U9_9SPHN|nr:nucleoside-diphosphate sugar epimerase/dehydratase [Tsuneonella dongtanensis]ANY18926.1 UDP-N-acetyl-alpha-D-glucosamine C6 dehydratase [Tsuneonella dongtanensis]